MVCLHCLLKEETANGVGLGMGVQRGPFRRIEPCSLPDGMSVELDGRAKSRVVNDGRFSFLYFFTRRHGDTEIWKEGRVTR